MKQRFIFLLLLLSLTLLTANISYAIQPIKDSLSSAFIFPNKNIKPVQSTSSFSPVTGSFPVTNSTSDHRTDYDLNTTNIKPFDLVSDDAGNIWFTGFDNNKIWRLNVEEKYYEEFELPAGIDSFRIKYSGNNTLWFTDYDYSGDSGRRNLVRFNTLTSEITLFEVPTLNAAPFDLVVTPDVVWFTEWHGEKIGKLELGIEPQIIEFPAKCEGEICGPVGLDIYLNTSLWYVDTYNPAFVKFDIQSARQQRYALPKGFDAPVDVMIDNQGLIWTGEHAGDRLLAFDPDTEEFSFFVSPRPPPEFFFYSGINDLEMDENGIIWFTEHFVNRIGRLDPVRRTIMEYILPRDRPLVQWLDIDQDSNIWYAEYETGIIGKIENQDVPIVRVDLEEPIVQVFSTSSLSQSIPINVSVTLTNKERLTLMPFTQDSLNFQVSSQQPDFTALKNQSILLQAEILVKKELPNGIYHIPVGVIGANFTATSTLTLQINQTSQPINGYEAVYLFGVISILAVVRRTKKTQIK